MYDPRPPMWARILGAAIPLGRPFGVPVEMHVLALVLSLGFGLSNWREFGAGWGEAFVGAIIGTIVVYGLVWVHEMGHIVGGRRYNIPAVKITLWPLGGLAHLGAQSPGPKADAVVTAAGPLTHVLWLLPAWLLQAALPWGGTRPAGWMLDPAAFAAMTLWYSNLAFLLFNLLPFFPMDGGRLLIAGLTYRLGEGRALYVGATIGLGGAVLLGVASFFPILPLGGGLLLALAIVNGLACHRMRVAAAHGASLYAAHRREAWESDGEAWRGGGTSSGATPSGRERRSAAKAEREAARSAADDAELDALLDRVGKVGLAGLSRSERTRLQGLSQRRSGGRG